MSLRADSFPGFEIIDALAECLGIVVGVFAAGELAGAGFDLFTQGVSLGEQLDGLGKQLLFRAVMTEGQLLGDETVEFWQKIGRHVGLREHYIAIGGRI